MDYDDFKSPAPMLAMRDLAVTARRAHDPAFCALLDYVDAVREQADSSARRDGAAAALELVANEVRQESGCFSIIDGYQFVEVLKKRIRFYEELADPKKYKPGEFADHVARHAGAAASLTIAMRALEEAGTFNDYSPRKMTRMFYDWAVKYRTGEKKI